LHQFTTFSAADNFAIPSTLKIFARISLLTVQDTSRRKTPTAVLFLSHTGYASNDAIKDL